MKQIKIIKNRYVDSVTLMSIGEKTIAATGAENAEAQMATPANLEVLSMLGYGVSAGATPNDLVLAVTAKDKETLDRAFAQMEALKTICNPGWAHNSAAFLWQDRAGAEHPFSVEEWLSGGVDLAK